MAEPIFITTADETGWLPEPLACEPQRVLSGPNRSDYLLVTVTKSKGLYPNELVIATRHEGFSLEALPDNGSIPVYIVQLKHPLGQSEHSFRTEDIQQWQLGSAYGRTAVRGSGRWNIQS